MKRIIPILLLCCFFLQPARAREADSLAVTQPCSNGIGVSVISGTGAQIATVYLSALVSLIASLAENNIHIAFPTPVPFSLEYERWLNDNLALGICLNTDIISAMPLLAFGNLSAMPTVKYRWVKTNSLSLYSKAAAGYSGSFYCEIQDGKPVFKTIPQKVILEQLGSVSTESFPLFAYLIIPPFGLQLSPLCLSISLPAKNLDIFCEMGYGTLGWSNFGLKKYF